MESSQSNNFPNSGPQTTHGKILPFQPHPTHHHHNHHLQPLQPLPLSQQSDSSGELFVPQLEPIVWSDDDEQQPLQPGDEAPFFKSPMPQPRFSDIATRDIPNHPYNFSQSGPAPTTPLPPIIGFRQPSYESQLPSQLPCPKVANPSISSISPACRNDASFADAWIRGLQKDSALQSVPTPNRGNNQPIHHRPPNANVAAYITPHRILQRHTSGVAGPSNVAHAPNQLHRANVEQRQTSASLLRKNGVIPASLMMGLHQQRQQAPQQYYFSERQRNPYIQQHLARSPQFNSAAPADNPMSRTCPILEGAITKSPHGRGLRNLAGKIQCEECPEVFESKINARRHMGSCHTKTKKTYACIYCSASYGGAGARTLHMTRAHPQFMPQIPSVKPRIKKVDGEFRYFCWVPNCTKNYTVENNLKRHYKMHHLNIRYPCKCGNEATTKSNLQAHQTTCRIYQADCGNDFYYEEP